MYLALIEPGSYLEFPNPVPFDDGSGVIETGLLNEQGRLSGRRQAAVRPISPKDFDRILTRGLAEEQPLLPRIGMASLPEEMPFQLDEGQSAFVYEQERERVAAMTTRVVRDRVFRRVVLRAYGERCAVTGLKLINGGGRAEVAAAHIRPVEQNGPDIINNGVALSGTAHWMFDRGLIGFSDELDIIISRQVNDRDGVEDGPADRASAGAGPAASGVSALASGELFQAVRVPHARCHPGEAGAHLEMGSRPQDGSAFHQVRRCISGWIPAQGRDDIGRGEGWCGMHLPKKRTPT